LKKDYSYGIIPLQQREGQWYVLLIQHQVGHKRHADLNESPKQTAERELFEETGLRVVNYLSEQIFKETYIFTFNKQRIHKTVEYFVVALEGEVLLHFLKFETVSGVY
jgi:8-oxo-dGTP pyrophosphatase MutT (NUDIX family)